MGAFMFGSIIGGALFSLLLPVLILIAARFIPPMRRNPKVVYSVCAVLVLLVCALKPSPSPAAVWVASAISAALALLFLWWGYRRDVRALAPPPPTPSPDAPRKGTDY